MIWNTLCSWYKHRFAMPWYGATVVARDMDGIAVEICPLCGRENKKPLPNMETEKTLIPSIHISTNMRPRLRQGPVTHYLPKTSHGMGVSAFTSATRKWYSRQKGYYAPYCHGSSKKQIRSRARRLYVLCIGLSPAPTLCTFSVRLLSSSQSLDFLHIDFTTNIIKSQYPY